MKASKRFRRTPGGGNPAMKASKRWQDYATMAIGVLLFISPLVFGETSQSPAAPAAYGLGVLLILAASIGALNAEAPPSLIVKPPEIVSGVTVISTSVLGFTAV